MCNACVTGARQPAQTGRRNQSVEELSVSTATGLEMNLTIAGVGGRSYAFVIDWHIRVLVALLWMIVFTPLASGGIAAMEQRLGAATLAGLPIYVGVVPAVLIYLLYHPVLETGMHGHTPGKRIAGVRIVTPEGLTPTPGALLVRNVFRLIDMLPLFYALGLIVAAVTDRHVRIGDMAAGTLLIYVDEGAAASLDRSAVRIGATGLDPGQMELLDALLRRWRQLDAGRRMELGGRLLETICRARGEPVPEVRNLRDLRRRLRGIQRAGSGKDAR